MSRVTDVPYMSGMRRGNADFRVTPGGYRPGLGAGAAGVCDVVTAIKKMAGGYSARDVVGAACDGELSNYVRDGVGIVEPAYIDATQATLKLSDYVSLGNIEAMRDGLLNLQGTSNFIPETFTPTITGTIATWTFAQLTATAEVNILNVGAIGVRIRVFSTVQNSIAGQYSADTLGFVPPLMKALNGETVTNQTTGLANRAVTFELASPVPAFNLYLPFAVQLNGREGGLTNAVALETDATEPAYRVRLQGVQTGSVAVLNFITRNSPYAMELLQGALANE